MEKKNTSPFLYSPTMSVKFEVKFCECQLATKEFFRYILLCMGVDAC